MKYIRSELKYYLNEMQSTGLQGIFSELMTLDRNSFSSKGYTVRSLYFDSFDDECLFKKQSGLYARKKIRLRTYGKENEIFKFEIKRKVGTQVRKDSIVVSENFAKRVCGGEYEILLEHNNSILNEIYCDFVTKLYAPKVIVEYKRVAFIMDTSNVRITFDLNLSSMINDLDFFKASSVGMPVVIENKQILEVKFDQYLPGYIKRVLSSIAAERMAISKYTLARRFHKINKWEDN